MGVDLTLRPGERGTKKLVEEHGTRLIAVRYRTDRSTGERLKTVELVVGRWRAKRSRRKEDRDDVLLLRIAYDEVDLQRRVRAVHGVWNRLRHAWELRRHLVVSLGLEERVIGTLDEVERMQ